MRTSVAAALAVVVLSAGAASVALVGCAKEPGGPIEVRPDPVDFGEVVFPEQTTRTAVVRNRSARRLLLGPPTFNCTCFAFLDPPPTTLDPGEEATVRIVMDSTKTDPRRFQKTLTFSTDDPAHPKVGVPVVGEVVEYRRWSALRIELAPTAGGSAAKASVRPGEGFRLLPKQAVSSDHRIAVSLVPSEGGVDLVVAPVPEASKGPVRAQVRVDLVVEGRGRPARTFTDSIWVTGEVQ
jgi:hypothetical protein